MKAYSFRLAAIVRIRRIEAVLAQQAVADGARAVRQANENERARMKTYESAASQSGELDAKEFTALQEHGARLAEMLIEATTTRSILDAQLFEARSAAASAERRVAILERLDERRREEWRRAAQREDVAVLDDFATVRAAGRSVRPFDVD